MTARGLLSLIRFALYAASAAVLVPVVTVCGWVAATFLLRGWRLPTWCCRILAMPLVLLIVSLAAIQRIQAEENW